MPKILIVDDDGLIRTLLRTSLTMHGFQTVEAFNGKTGIQMVQQAEPDLIIMDLMMPELTGIQAIKILRTMPETKHIPIIALTADNSPQSEVEARSAGCDIFMLKPWKTTELLRFIESLLSLRQLKN